MSSRNNRDALITRHGYDHLHGCRSFPSPSRGHSWKPSAKECLGAAIPSECSECFADSMPILCCLKLLQSDVYLVYLVKSCEFKSWNHAKSWIVLLKEVSIPTFASLNSAMIMANYLLIIHKDIVQRSSEIVYIYIYMYVFVFMLLWFPASSKHLLRWTGVCSRWKHWHPPVPAACEMIPCSLDIARD